MQNRETAQAIPHSARLVSGREAVSRDSVAALGRAAGNRATSLLLPRRPAIEGYAQRSIENASYAKSIGDDDRKLATAFFDAYEKAVQDAYTYAVSVPSLGALTGLDGHTKHWRTLWDSFVAGGRPKLMAAAFGYVVESLASTSQDFRLALPSGCSVYTQVTSGGTRPDLVLRLTKGSRELAWIDLTASDSVDHIYSKEGWDTKIGTYAEITYPSVTPATLALMKQNKDNTGTLSKEEFDKRQAAAEEEYRERKERWRDRGLLHYRIGRHGAALRAKYRMLLPTQPWLKREYITHRLEADFDTGIPEKMVPSILAAMGVNPTPWEFTTGYSVSERAGEAWLVDNDPSWTEPPDPRGPGGKIGRERKSYRHAPY